MLSSIECVKKVIECDNARDAAGYRALLHDDYVSHVHGEAQPAGADAEVATLEAWWRIASDVHLELIKIVEAEGLVTLRYTLEGTNDGEFAGRPATGRRFHIENCTLFEIHDGKVQRVYRYADTLGLMRQLGMAGEPT